jgi:hypothetical protein
MTERQAERAVSKRAVVEPAMVFHPCRVSRVLMQIGADREKRPVKWAFFADAFAT